MEQEVMTTAPTQRPTWNWPHELDDWLLRCCRKSPATDSPEPPGPLFARGRNLEILEK